MIPTNNVLFVKMDSVLEMKQLNLVAVENFSNYFHSLLLSFSYDLDHSEAGIHSRRFLTISPIEAQFLYWLENSPSEQMPTKRCLHLLTVHLRRIIAAIIKCRKPSRTHM